jgi:hypothetical protein
VNASFRKYDNVCECVPSHQKTIWNRGNPLIGVSKNRFPSFRRRGGRAINKMAPKASFERRGRGGCSSHRLSIETTTPSAPAEEASRHFIDGAASPPSKGGESVIANRRSFIRTARFTAWTRRTYVSASGFTIKTFSPKSSSVESIFCPRLSNWVSATAVLRFATSTNRPYSSFLDRSL